MKITYIKTSSKEEFMSACKDVGLLDSDGQLIISTSDYFIDVIGVVYHETGVIKKDSTGNSYKERAESDGYHVNIASSHDIGLGHLSIDVSAPYRIISGLS